MIDINKTYIFSIADEISYVRETPTVYDLTSELFANKYSTWGEVEGKEVAIIAIKASTVKFHILGDGLNYWASVDASFLKPTNNYNIANLTPCSCNLWLSGCQCGVFRHEKKGPPPYQRKWRYIEKTLPHDVQ